MTDTPALLRAAIDRDYGGVAYRFCKAHGLNRWDVSDLLRGRGLGPARLNPIRKALGLPPVTRQPRKPTVKVAAPGHGKRRPYAQVTVCVDPATAELWRVLAEDAGVSVSEFVRENMRPSALYGM